MAPFIALQALSFSQSAELCMDAKPARQRVWFYLKDKDTERAFVNELNENNATYLNGSLVTIENCSPIMAVHNDMKVAHLMIMIWNASFSSSFEKCASQELAHVLKVDYAKYREGERDYLCERSAFVPIG